MSKIVVIEDDNSVRENLLKILLVEGYEVFGASNGKDGLLIIIDEDPDLIICDIMLPDLDGYQVLEKISENKLLRAIPFIFLTAKVEMSDIRRGMNLGADDYITKPFHVSDLLDAVKIRLMKSKVRSVTTEPYEEEDESKNKILDLNQRLFLPSGSDVQFVIVNDILCITSDTAHSLIQTSKGEKILVRKNMKEWEAILPEDTFLRIHKSTIININWIQKIEKWFNNSYRIILQDIKEPFVISRKYATKLRETFRP
ncbi:MAG: hypothetical protein CVV23_04885 [Ignavibacteriae bacterium HGW-Ignavibacteriae-2]|jgi:DNA-binding LytR/AlgR family response regulator|nr:MAG: hypothetical protein CVV23_04885 [Ignavibacteriae bacterium HGW-Ignavibacteriae-2]